MKLDIDQLYAHGYDVKVNDEEYEGRLAVGDTLVVNGYAYAVCAINEDCVLVKELS